MALHPQSIKPIPRLTKEVAHQAFPKGNFYMTLRDKLGTFYSDPDFAELYSVVVVNKAGLKSDKTKAENFLSE